MSHDFTPENGCHKRFFGGICLKTIRDTILPIYFPWSGEGHERQREWKKGGLSFLVEGTKVGKYLTQGRIFENVGMSGSPLPLRRGNPSLYQIFRETFLNA